MVKELSPIDISNIPELLRLVEEVREADRPRLLRKDDEDLAILMPAKPGSKHKPKPNKTKADYEAFCSAFGGWKDIVDADALKEDIASARGSDRPSVEL